MIAPMRPSRLTPATTREETGPSASFFDRDVPAYVKRTYSPRSAWRDRPFGPRDEAFFVRGVEALSRLYTVDREAGHGSLPLPRDYLNNPRYRSAYLLYFMPMQAAKFSHLFRAYPRALDSALAHAAAEGCLRVADLGCGPGTASAALLLSLAERRLAGLEHSPVPPIELTWYDTHAAILEDGQAIIGDLRRRLDAVGFSPDVSLTVRRQPWHRVLDAAPPGNWSLTLLGNVINETLPAGRAPTEREQATWRKLIAQNGGGGVLTVGPAIKPVAQHLSRLRDVLVATGDGGGTLGHPLHGPCLHAGPCPLSAGRDWCHFSVQTDVPGALFGRLSSRLGSVRSWLKFCWIWFAAPTRPGTPHDPSERRVVSDPLDGTTGTVLLCEPGRPARYQRAGRLRLRRGDVIRLAPAPRAPGRRAR